MDRPAQAISLQTMILASYAQLYESALKAVERFENLRYRARSRTLTNPAPADLPPADPVVAATVSDGRATEASKGGPP